MIIKMVWSLNKCDNDYVNRDKANYNNDVNCYK